MDIYTSPTLDNAEAVYAPVKFWLIYAASIIFTFFALFTAYSSSTYLEQFMTSEQVSLLYAAGALVGVAMFCIIPFVLQRYGNVRITIGLMSISVLMLLLMGLAPSTAVVIGSFIIFFAILPIIRFNIDIFTETLIGGDEGNTGKIRGLTLTLMSVAALAAPYTMGLVIEITDDLAIIYFIAMAVGLLFIVFIIGAFRQFYDPKYHPIRLGSLLINCYRNRNVRLVLYTSFLLQLFFSWTVIYFPLYLATEVGLSWRVISEIIAFGLLAYVIFEYPIGILADRYIGEKEMMLGGFAILTVTTALIPVTATYGIFAWMALMFMSRVGASLVEVTTESYFFKQVDGSDASVMSLFRITRPLAICVGALLGSVTLLFLPLQMAFFVLAAVMATGLFASVLLVDTK